MFRPDPADPSRSLAKRDDVPEVSVREEVSATALALLPWSISILAHAALVVLAFFVIWAVMADRAQEKIVVPELTLSEHATQPFTSPTQQRVTRESRTRSIADAQAPNPSLSEAMKVKLNTIGIAGGAAEAGFFNPIGTIGDDDNTFVGERIGGNVRSVVFVVDASGSLLDTFPFVILELKKTVRNLSEKQSFTIVFFQGDKAVEVPVPRTGMKPATTEVKQRVIEWIDPANGNIQPRGGTNPLPGMQQALRYRPQLMYLLSDNITGGGTGATQYEIEQQRLLDEVQRANSGNTKINTIQFLYPDPLAQVPGKQGTLEQIAERTGGRYKFVDAAELSDIQERAVP
jgi:biopolymer transport protein ExbD